MFFSIVFFAGFYIIYLYKVIQKEKRKETDLMTNISPVTPVTSHSRHSGILVHPTSFPSVYGIGDLGKGAYDFIDYLVSAGQTLWQTLPLGPTGFGDSPYQGFSAFAGQPLLISPDKLFEQGLLSQKDLDDYPILNSKAVDYGAVLVAKNKLLASANKNFANLPEGSELVQEYKAFCEKQAFWLDDYALFMSIKDKNDGKLWLEWKNSERNPSATEKETLKKELSERISYYKVIQFLFFNQWYALKKYANEHLIKIIGDIPIFVSLDSADVWANKDLFELDSKGYPTVVAGVPPDYFSETGQLWGNPLYDWDAHEKQNYAWWISRVRSQLALVDIIRIDHFRGFDSYWAVPYGEATAINGTWKAGPKEKLFNAIKDALGDLPIWAEDLGIITEDVEKLRDKFNFPGMKVLQFAFDDPNDNDMMPYYHIPNCICYTGTHDNDTSLGWYKNASKESQKKVRRFMNTGAATVSWAFIHTALGSAANNVIIPLQDIMSLDSDARMNTPGRAAGNWSWRYEEKDLDLYWAKFLKKLTKTFNRNKQQTGVM